MASDSSKAMESGAASAKNTVGLGDGVHGSAPPKDDSILASVTAAADKVKSQFSTGGAVGQQFTPEGAIGGTAQQVGGPLDKEGVIGKQFTESGAVGGTIQDQANK